MQKREIGIVIAVVVLLAALGGAAWIAHSHVSAPPTPEQEAQAARAAEVAKPKPVRAAAIAPRPTQAEIDAVSAALRQADVPAQDEAVAKIHGWLDGNVMLIEYWSTWMPSLRTLGRQQDIADIALALMTNPVNQPYNDAISTVAAQRVMALLALKKSDEALQAAKSYYNVCEMTNTPKATDLVAQALAQLHPDDAQIARAFRAEQNAASNAVGPDGVMTDKIDPSPTMAAIKIEVRAYDDAVARFGEKTGFAAQVLYGNLLLMSDRSGQAEALFQELLQGTTSASEIRVAKDGVARAMRAVDGNPARAKAWLITGKTPANGQ